MANYENKKPYNNIKPNKGEQLVPILAYDLLKWEDDSVRNGLSTPGQLVNKENLETWNLDGRRVLVGFVAVPNDQAEAAIDDFWKCKNKYIEDTRSKRCLIANKKGELIRCPKSNKCSLCDQQYNPERITSHTISLDKFIDDSFDIDSRGYDPTRYDDFSFEMVALRDLIDQVSDKYPEADKILNLLIEKNQKKEILEQIDIGVKKTEGYKYISKIQNYLKDLYENS